MELSYSHNSLGSLYLKQFNYTGAKQRFTKSLTLKNKALELKPNNKNLLRDKADTISWIASTEENLGNFNAALSMYESASNELSHILMLYPNDASLFKSIANIYIQQSKLLSYLPNKERAYIKAKQATESINKALLQDPQSNKFQRMYNQFLAYQLLFSKHKNIDERIYGIINFIKEKNFSDKKVVSTYINLINYFIKMNLSQKAQKLLDEFEYKIQNKTALTRVSLIKAKLAVNKNIRAKFCKQAITTMSEMEITTQSVNITYPLMQAYTCLNRANEIPRIKSHLVKLGITNFQL